MQTTQHVGWTKTMKAKAETRRHASNLLLDIRAGKLSVYAAAEGKISRYSLAEAFDIQPNTPESLTEQTLICLIPERVRASLN